MNFIIRNRKKFLLGFSIFICLTCLVNLIVVCATQIKPIIDMDAQLGTIPGDYPMYAVLYNQFVGMIVDLIIPIVGFALGLIFGLIGLLFYKQNKLEKIDISYMFSIVAICLTYAALGVRCYAMNSPENPIIIAEQITAAMVLGFMGIVFAVVALFIPKRLNKWIRFAAYAFAFLWLMASAAAMLNYYSVVNQLAPMLPDEQKAMLGGMTFAQVLVLFIGLVGIFYAYLLIIDDTTAAVCVPNFRHHKENAIEGTIQPVAPAPVYRPAAAPKQTFIDPIQRLKDIKELVDLDILTPEEFNQVKQRYLDIL